MVFGYIHDWCWTYIENINVEELAPVVDVTLDEIGSSLESFAAGIRAVPAIAPGLPPTLTGAVNVLIDLQSKLSSALVHLHRLQVGLTIKIALMN